MCIRLAFLLSVTCAVAWTATYEVGPGRTYTSIGAVPWESLSAGDTVRIHHRASPYKEKWVIGRSGTSVAPITITGVPGSGGELPVIDGDGATTRSQLNYWARNRGVIKVGGSSTPSSGQVSWVVIENLDITSGRQPYGFIAPNGATESYANNAAAIFIESGNNITVRNCVIRNSGNGLFVAHGPSSSITVTGCYIHGNGVESSILEHNVYTEARGIVFEGNRLGPLRSGCNGNNLKDRSAGTIIRYNWIEGGNRQLDLVESEDYADIRNDASYRTTFAYGNVLVEPSGAGNRQIIHYGGDGGDQNLFRRGTLHLYHNTIISYRTDRTVLVRLSSSADRLNAVNNVIYTTASGNTMFMLEDNGGTMNLTNCWLKTGWQNGVAGGTVHVSGNLTGSAPGFVNESGRDFQLAAGSPCIAGATTLPADALPTNQVTRRYVTHLQTSARADTQDIGAFPRLGSGGGGDQAPVLSSASASPTTVSGHTTVVSATASDDGGEAALTYTWSATPGTVAFSPNGNNAAKNSTATFSAGGTYTLTVTARDGGGQTATRTVTVTVQRIATTVVPGQTTVSVTVGENAALSAQVRDQFGASISGAPLAWSIQSGGGTVNTVGLYTAPATPGGVVVRVASGAPSATIQVQVVAGGDGGGGGSGGGSSSSDSGSSGCGLGGAVAAMLMALTGLFFRQRLTE